MDQGGGWHLFLVSLLTTVRTWMSRFSSVHLQQYCGLRLDFRCEAGRWAAGPLVQCVHSQCYCGTEITREFFFRFSHRDLLASFFSSHSFFSTSRFFSFFSVYLSIRLSIYLSIYPSIYLSIYLSVYVSINPSIHLTS